MKFTLVAFSLFFCFNAVCQSSVKNDSIPFFLTESNNISVSFTLNGRDNLQLMFHIATSGVSITSVAAEQLTSIHWNSSDTVESWGGSTVSRFSQNNFLKIGSNQWDSLLLVECMHSGKNTDGKFGPDLFGNKIIEINFDQSILVLHQQLPHSINKYEKVDLISEKGMLFIKCIVDIENESTSNRFLLHSGYSSSLLFDDEFTALHEMGKKLPLLSENELLDSFGNRLKTKKSLLQQFQVGGVRFNNIPISFFEGSIGRQKISVLGMDVLKRFNLILDKENKVLYLQKNQHFSSPYFKG